MSDAEVRQLYARWARSQSEPDWWAFAHAAAREGQPEALAFAKHARRNMILLARDRRLIRIRDATRDSERRNRAFDIRGFIVQAALVATWRKLIHCWTTLRRVGFTEFPHLPGVETAVHDLGEREINRNLYPGRRNRAPMIRLPVPAHAFTSTPSMEDTLPPVANQLMGALAERIARDMDEVIGHSPAPDPLAVECPMRGCQGLPRRPCTTPRGARPRPHAVRVQRAVTRSILNAARGVVPPD